MLERLLVLDHTLSARLTIRRAGLLRLVAQAIAHTGDGAVWIAIGAGLGLIDQPGPALRIEITVFTLIAIVAALKIVVRRRRPTGERGKLYFEMDAHSFPSGHAARMAGLAVTLGALNPALAIGLAIWAALVSLARVALGIHYLLDVAVGAGLGIGAAIVILLR
jgi:undecaprenyl-diphosphatase